MCDIDKYRLQKAEFKTFRVKLIFITLSIPVTLKIWLDLRSIEGMGMTFRHIFAVFKVFKRI